MGLKWTDVNELAILLSDRFPQLDPLQIRFTDLSEWVCELDEFDDLPQHCNERILEAIQQAWIDELD